MSAVALRLPLYIKSGFRAYSFLSQQRPLITGIATTTSFAVLGDIGSQYLVQKNANPGAMFTFKLDVKRTIKFGFTGMLFAPQMVLWYRYIQYKIPGQSLKIATKRVMYDQFVFASWSTAYFLSFNKLLDGASVHDIQHNVHSKWVDTFTANALLWPPFQFINFYLVPPHFRVLGSNLVSLGWSTYLSFKAHQ
eukprot:72040_1